MESERDKEWVIEREGESRTKREEKKLYEEQKETHILSVV